MFSKYFSPNFLVLIYKKNPKKQKTKNKNKQTNKNHPLPWNTLVEEEN